MRQTTYIWIFNGLKLTSEFETIMKHSNFQKTQISWALIIKHTLNSWINGRRMKRLPQDAQRIHSNLPSSNHRTSLKEEPSIKDKPKGLGRYPIRNALILHLYNDLKMTPKDISNLKWKDVLDNSGILKDEISLTDNILHSSRVIELSDQTRNLLIDLLEVERFNGKWMIQIFEQKIIRTERMSSASPQVISNLIYGFQFNASSVKQSKTNSKRKKESIHPKPITT